MSKVIKVVLILAIATLAIAARQLTSSDAKHAAAAAGNSVEPMELMRKAGPLPPTEVESYY